MSFFEQLLIAESNGIRCAACTIIKESGTTPRSVGSKMIVYENGELFGTIGGGSLEQDVKNEALKAIQANKHFTEKFVIDKQSKLNDDFVEIFIETINPRINLLIFGAGHIGKQVAFFSKHMGWHTVIIDDRPELCNSANIPYGDEFIIGFSNDILNMLVKRDGYGILTTRNSDLDLIILKNIVNRNFNFIGVLGSKKRWENTKKELLAAGVSELKLNKIYAPIGIEIYAETPEEIAISIISQIIMIRNNKNKDI
jgi:xanthine dehydrogenase accessory factor